MLSGVLGGTMTKIESIDYYLSDGLGSGFTSLINTSSFIGFAYLVDKRMSVYANFSNHYDTPTLNELSNDPDSLSIGGFNSNLNLKYQKALKLVPKVM